MAPSSDAHAARAARRSETYDVVVVGAGFAGLYALHRLRSQGLSVRVFEAGSGVGGTWFWNRYPGARCDVDSMEYSYQFSDELQQEWRWSERYATQPEILRYLEHVADRFDLRGDIQLDSRVQRAAYDEATATWSISIEGGARLSARFFIMATGCLSSTNTPGFEGLERFAGERYHTGQWPPEGVDFRGKRVGVIGTGSSAIQSIPIIAAQADHLFVFQRTPNYSVPAYNGPLDPEQEARIKAEYPAFRERNAQMASGFGADHPRGEAAALESSPEERRRVYEARWAAGGLPFLGGFTDLLLDREANETAAEFVRERIREKVKDPEVAERLCPTTPIGCKRLCVDSGYYETFNRSNVTLVDVQSDPIEGIGEAGITTRGGEFGLDAIVFATGFDAMTGSIFKVDIRGRHGLPLREKWSAGPRTYLGLGSEGFPNLFTITGPGSPSVLSNMVPSIEQHVNWIADCLEYMKTNGYATIEVERGAEDAWVEHVNAVAEETIFPSCNSWYLGANVPGKPRVFMPYLGFPAYVAKCDEVAAKGYEGFRLCAPDS